jgi:transcription elongation factor Elf1
MKEISKLQKIIWFITDIPLRTKQSFCHHRFFTMFSAEVFTVEKYERCSGSAECSKCGLSATVYVPENEKEIEKLLNARFDLIQEEV